MQVWAAGLHCSFEEAWRWGRKRGEGRAIGLVGCGSRGGFDSLELPVPKPMEHEIGAHLYPSRSLYFEIEPHLR